MYSAAYKNLLPNIALNYIIWSVVLVSSLTAGILLYIYITQDRLIYLPDTVMIGSPADRGLPFDDVYFRSGDGVQLHGWFVPAPRARGTLLFFHGNGGNISWRLESIEEFHRMGLNVFILDYRGYGLSEGKPSEQGTYADADAAWHYLTGERGIPAESIVLFGRSLGGAIAAWLAAQRPHGALILEAAFTSAPDIARLIYPWLPVRLVNRYQYNTLEYVRSAPRPVLIVHARDDQVAPFHFGESLYAAAPEPKSFLAIEGPHNSTFAEKGGQYPVGLGEFLNSTLGPIHET